MVVGHTVTSFPLIIAEFPVSRVLRVTTAEQARGSKYPSKILAKQLVSDTVAEIKWLQILRLAAEEEVSAANAVFWGLIEARALQEAAARKLADANALLREDYLTLLKTNRPDMALGLQQIVLSVKAGLWRNLMPRYRAALPKIVPAEEEEFEMLLAQQNIALSHLMVLYDIARNS